MEGTELRDHPFGVVFYLLRKDQVPREWSTGVAQDIAREFADSFVVRFGMRDGKESDTYWVGFNSSENGGARFEWHLRNRAKRLLRQIQRTEPTFTERDVVTVRRAYRLPVLDSDPNSKPNPPLLPVLPDLLPEAQSAPARSAFWRRPIPPDQVDRGGLMDQARVARQRLRDEGVGLGDAGEALAGLTGRIPKLRRRRGGSDEES